MSTIKRHNLPPLLIALITAFAAAFPASAGRPQIGVKTNLLYDAVLSPNLGVEAAVAPHWSVEVSGNYNNWDVNGHLWKHWFVQPEGRYWFCESFGGHFVALHAIAGEYNWGNLRWGKWPGSDFSKLRDRRYQGWGAGLGIGYGYSWILSNYWNIEAEIALGWIHTRYDSYPCASCGSKLESGARHNYFGPTKMAVNLIYVF